jgi:uncharacterized repeat protein (TIGR03803 family)
MSTERKFRIIGGRGLAAAALAIVAIAAGAARAATLTPLVAFSGTNGMNPSASLILDASGNLFGTTFNGGPNCPFPDGVGCGTVFEIVKTGSGYASAPIVLYSFCAQGGASCTDGAQPSAGLVADASGNLFGTTDFGGANGRGTVFEIVKTTSGYASAPIVLYSFCAQGGASCTDGAAPGGGLIADDAGNLFGATGEGGAHNAGTVFEIFKTVSGYASPPTVLVNFCSLPGCADGAFPNGGLLADSAGNLLGTTSGGGTGGAGTAFAIAKTVSGYANTADPFLSFCNPPATPDCPVGPSGLIKDTAGNLYGTTSVGGAHGRGTVFQISFIQNVAPFLTVVYSFCAQGGLSCTDGAYPLGGVILDAAGNLFGTTELGGANGVGTVFKIVNKGLVANMTILANFCCTDGASPVAGLIADRAGNLFGTAVEGGGTSFSGTVFEVAGSGYAVGFAGVPGISNCFGVSVETLANNYGGIAAAAEALGYSSVTILKNAIDVFCAGG